MNYLIDPNDVISYDRTTGELELFWLFCLCVAGKTARTQARLLNDFINSLPTSDHPQNDTPFERIHKSIAVGDLLERIRESRLGQYNRLVRAFSQSVTLDLQRCTVDDLEAIHGVGPKTARMFLMMSRPGVRHAALDTHILKYLRSQNIDAPKTTPSAGNKYRILEDAFLKLADESGQTVAEFDLNIWKMYSNGIPRNSIKEN